MNKEELNSALFCMIESKRREVLCLERDIHILICAKNKITESEKRGQELFEEMNKIMRFADTPREEE